MRYCLHNLILIFIVLASVSGVKAASSDVRLEKADIRLLDGGQMPDGQRLAGLEIRLQDGVKTYWRMPGESGLPPVFDFSASRNIASVDVKWPIPSRFAEADGTILGFKDHVIFPFVVTMQSADAPARLAVNLDFGLCDKLCLPAKAELVRSLSIEGNIEEKQALTQFLNRVPKVGAVKGPFEPSVLSITPDGKSLAITVASASPLKDLILEAAGSWFFGEAMIMPLGSGRYRALVPIEQKPSAATLGGLALAVTAIAEDGATETPVTLDATGSIR